MKPIARIAASGADLLSVARAHLGLLLCFGSFVLTTSVATAVELHTCGDGRAVPGHYIIRAQGSSASTVSTASQKSASSRLEQLMTKKPSRLIHRSLHATSSVSALGSQQLTEKSTSVVSTVAIELSGSELAQLSNDESVLSIEEDCLVQIDSDVVPNDPIPADFTRAREQLNLPAAWSMTTDSSQVIVAVSDTGVDLTHEDLAENLWTNTAELNGRAGFDDDDNGCFDDVHGCDFGDYDGDPSPPKTAQGGHGTHVAGIIGAVGNNSRGTAGVSWRAKILVAKGFDSGGFASVSDLLNTVYYSINNGARVINCSWGADRTPTEAEKDAFQYALDKGVLAVVAAGNSSIDASRSSPASLSSVLTVGSINSHDQVSAFSNYGARVQVYAPGGEAGALNEYIYSTFPGNTYGPLRGTSMAAPFVTGIAALVLSVNARLSAVDVRNIIVSTSRSVSSKLPDGSTSTIRIPDAAAALTLAATYTPTPYGTAQQPTSPVYQSPKADHTGPEFVETSSTSSCALHRRAETNLPSLILFLFPIGAAFALRKREHRA